MEECEQLGVECMMETVAYEAQDTADKVTVHTVSGGTKSSVHARKGIVADGANAHITESLGMNKERKYDHTAFVEKYIVDGVNDDDILKVFRCCLRIINRTMQWEPLKYFQLKT